MYLECGMHEVRISTHIYARKPSQGGKTGPSLILKVLHKATGIASCALALFSSEMHVVRIVCARGVRQA